MNDGFLGSVNTFVRGGRGFLQIFGRHAEKNFIVASPVVEAFDPTSPCVGEVLEDSLRRSGRLVVQQDEAIRSYPALQAALGGRPEGTRLFRSWAVVEIKSRESGIRLTTNLLPRGPQSAWRWPGVTVPNSCSADDLGAVFCRLASEAELFLLEQGMIKGLPTFPVAK